jgi:hypothetical protein
MMRKQEAEKMVFAHDAHGREEKKRLNLWGGSAGWNCFK